MYLQALIALVPWWFIALFPDGESAWDSLVPGWERAGAEVVRQRAARGEVFRSLGVNEAECEAIIFPEQLRFSRLQNGLEQAALFALYVRGGKEAADFSIGPFQMKPSFAEEVERAWMRSELRHAYRLYFPVSESADTRRRRVERLSDERWQCVYLACFVRLLLEREPGLAALPATERVSLLATAYNTRFSASMKEWKEWQHRKRFHLDLLPSCGTVYHAYAGLAVEWFRQGVRKERNKDIAEPKSLQSRANKN